MVTKVKASRRGQLVAVLVYDGLSTFEFGIVADVFGQERPDVGDRWYRLVSCGVHPGPFRALGGLRVTAEADLGILEQADMIVAPGWPIGTRPPDELLLGLRAANARGARIVSICTGAFLLAEAGVLEGKRVTTHWRHVAAFRSTYPHIEVEPDVLYVDEGSVLTSAGSAAGIDLLLHIVRTDYGPDAANKVARGLVVPAHRDGGQAQFIERPVPARPNGRLAPLLDFMRSNIGRVMTVPELASRAAMSPRTFLRRFREMTGTTPAGWLMDLRLTTARRMLEEESTSLDAIALAVGFGTAATMRLHFRNRLGVSPSEYRARFRWQTTSQGGSGTPARLDRAV